MVKSWLSGVFEALKFAVFDRETRVKTLLYSIALFLVFGIPTALISNGLIPYIRMVPADFFDYAFLVSTSFLGAVYLAIPQKSTCPAYKSAFGGGFLGFLSFGCPVCNKLLVLLLGTGFLYNVINPIRPLLGILSAIFLLYAIVGKWERPHKG